VGDLYITVNVGGHPYFRRKGRDVHVEVPISVEEAVFGGAIEVPSLEGPLEVEIPAGRRTGSVMAIPAKGVPSPEGTGDLVLTFQIALPETLDERSRQLVAEFGRLNRGDVRRHLFT
jgi:molecular chaperone DnaJ